MSATILIAANPYDAATMRQTLSGEDATVDVVGSIEDLPARVEAALPNLLIMAGGLLRVSIPKLIQEIRTGDHGSAVQLLLIGKAGDEVSTLAQARDVGADYYLFRPADGALLAKVREVCGEGGPGSDGMARQGSPAAIGAIPTRLEEVSDFANSGTSLIPQPEEVSEFPTDKARRDRSASDAGGWESFEEGTLARELMLELQSADQRLFPQSAAPLSLFSWQDYPSVVSEHRESVEFVLGSSSGTNDVPSQKSQTADDLGRLSEDARSESQLEPTPVELRRASRPTLEQVKSSSARLPLTGDLRTVSVARLYWHAASQRLSCRLVLRQGEKETTVYWVDGCFFGADSTSVDDGFPQQLVQQGKIDREQLRDLEHLTIPASEIAQVLVDRDLIKRNEVAGMLRSRCLNIVYSVFGWREGLYQILLSGEGDAVGEVEHHDFGLSPIEMLWEGIRRKTSLEQLRQILGGPERAVRLIEPDEAQRAYDFLDTEEAEIVLAIRKPKTIAALQEIADPLVVYQTLYALSIVGALSLDGGAAGQGMQRTRDEREIAIERQRIAIKYAQVREGDYFTLLGVKADASRHEVMRAYMALRDEFSPEAFAGSIRTETETELRSIGTILAEAYRILYDDGLRKAYRSTMEPGS